MNFAVTTVRNNASDFEKIALEWASKLNTVYIRRKDYGKLEDLLDKNALDAIIIAGSGAPQIKSAAGNFFYHSSMAILRIQKLKNNENDNFVQALGIKPGMKILDATLGLASDAAIASYVVGPSGSVIGLEASKILYFVVQYGLKTYTTGDTDLDEALRRIRAINIEAEEYLINCQENSFDIVYFDPMFRHPVNGSAAMHSLRPLAYTKPLTKRTIQLALKAAPIVVIKERTENILRQYNCTEFAGGKYSKVKYGIIRR